MTSKFYIAQRIASSRILISGALLSSALVLSGCESGTAVLGDSSGAQPETKVGSITPAPAMTRVSVAPVIGAPDSIAKQLQSDFSKAVGQKNVTVVGAQDKADFALRGYIVAAKDKGSTKVSYIWDVTDPAGQRVNRITGEEIVAGTSAADAWAGVAPPVLQSIAQKAAGSLTLWIGQQTAAKPAMASAEPPKPMTVATPSAPIGVGAVSPTPVGSLPPTTAISTPPQQIASAQPAAAKEPLGAVVSSLSGAPGDGNNALAKALQAELSKNGINTANAGTAGYRVDGVVKMGLVSDGKQPIQIDWNVKDAQGKKVGTVTQKNEIPAGSLDTSWGKTADAAASAAAQGILKLLPKATVN